MTLPQLPRTGGQAGSQAICWDAAQMGHLLLGTGWASLDPWIPGSLSLDSWKLAVTLTCRNNFLWELGGGSRWLHGVWGLWQGLVLGLSREWVAAHTPAPGAPPDSGARP